MRTTVLLFSMLVCLGAGSLANPQTPKVPADRRKGFDSFQPADLHRDVAFLASDKLEGRMSMRPGDDKAVAWIAGQFAKAGLDPVAINANGMPSYKQTFDIVQYLPDRAYNSLTLVRGGRPTVWHAPQVTGAYKHPVNITAPVVFAGYGITAPGLNYDDYAGINVQGKIVLIFDHEPQEDDPQSTFDGTANTKYATTRVKLLNAQMHGAVAVIMVAEPNRKHPTNAERVAKIGGSTERTQPVPLQAIDHDELSIPSVTVLDDVAETLLASTGTTGSAIQTRIDGEFHAHSTPLPDTTVTLQLRNLAEESGSISNVVALLKGSDPSLAAETVLISAHHDHDGEAPCHPGQGGIGQEGQPTPAGADCMEIWHGADDNASGSVGVIALARAFAANAAKPKRSVLFVVFAGEERGLLGSYWMAQHPIRPLATTRAMINFDMIGRDERPSLQTEGLIEVPADTSNRLNIVGAGYSPEYKSIIVEQNSQTGLVLDDRFDHEHVLNVLFRSDQFPFLLRNVPALWWFTGFHPDYHHSTDTAEKLDYPKMAKILQLAYLTAWQLTGVDQPPKFVADPQPAPPPPPPGTAAAGPEPVHHRPIIPVMIMPTTGEAGQEARSTASEPEPEFRPAVPAPTAAAVSPDPAVPANAVSITPVATPVTPPAATASTAPPAGAVSITPQPAAVAAPAAKPVAKPHRPVASVTIAPTAENGNTVAPPPVTPVRLGGKQPGEDQYEDPQ